MCICKTTSDQLIQRVMCSTKRANFATFDQFYNSKANAITHYECIKLIFRGITKSSVLFVFNGSKAMALHAELNILLGQLVVIFVCCMCTKMLTDTNGKLVGITSTSFKHNAAPLFEIFHDTACLTNGACVRFDFINRF